MNTKLAISGGVLLVLAITSLVLFQFTDFLAPTEADSTTLVGGSTNGWNPVFNQSTTPQISGLYSALTVLVQLYPSIDNQEFTIQIGLQFPTGQFPGCNDVGNPNLPCIAAEAKFTVTGDSRVSIQAFERRLPAIPLLVSGNGIPADTPRVYYVSVSSTQSFHYDYRGVARSRFGFILFLPLLIASIAVLVVAFVKDSSGAGFGRLKKRSWQEPTLGGSSMSRGSRGPATPVSPENSKKVNTAVNCKKCGGVMPRNAQYCPHCYTRQ